MSFITNAPDKTLQGRLEALLQHAQELKFLKDLTVPSQDVLRKLFSDLMDRLASEDGDDSPL